MKKLLMVTAFLCGTTVFATEVKKAERKPNQLSDVTHRVECSGQTKAGVKIIIRGETDIFYNLKDLVDVIIMRGGHADPSRASVEKFAYDSTHKARNKAAHQNVFAFIRGSNNEIVLNYAKGSAANKLAVVDLNLDSPKTETALPASVKCKGIQVGSYD